MSKNYFFLKISSIVFLLLFSTIYSSDVLAQNAIDYSEIQAENENIQSVQNEDFSVEYQTKNFTYKVNTPTIGNVENFNSLSDQDKASFLTKRKFYLGLLIKGLNLFKYGLGIGVVAKDTTKYFVSNMMKKIKRPSQVDIQSVESQNKNLTFKEISERSIQALINKLDQGIWEQAELFSRSNEAGFSAAMGLQLLGGRGDKGHGGLIDIGVSVGFNMDDKSLVIQFFTDIEKYQSTDLGAVFIAGVVVKTGLYILNQKENSSMSEGSTYYPPMFPGFRTKTRNSLYAGFSSGLTWPPSPIGDFLTYNNDSKKIIIARISFSKNYQSFVKLQSFAGQLMSDIFIRANRVNQLKYCRLIF